MQAPRTNLGDGKPPARSRFPSELTSGLCCAATEAGWYSARRIKP
jgi:hypothetical protein